MGFKPHHALAVIIGDERRESIESAVEDLRTYIKTQNLVKTGSNLIQADDRLFALAGQMYIKDSDLAEIVENHMSSS